MNQAVIMEFVDAHTAIALTADMAFVRIAREPGMMIGAQVDVPLPLTAGGETAAVRVVHQERSARSDAADGVVLGSGDRFLRRKKSGRQARTWGFASAAAVLALAAVAFGGVQSAFAAPVAYVSVDVNPSIELAVSSQERVVGVDALDAAAKRLLAHVSLTRLPIKTAIDRYLQVVLQAGYLKDGASVIVTTSAAHANETLQAEVPKLQRQVNQEVARELRGHKYTFASLVVSSALRQAARASHVSPGRLALYAQAKLEGKKVSWSDIQTGHLAQAVGGPGTLSKLVQTLSGDSKLVQALGHVAGKQVTAPPTVLAQAAVALAKPAPPAAPPLAQHATSGAHAPGVGGGHGDHPQLPPVHPGANGPGKGSAPQTPGGTPGAHPPANGPAPHTSVPPGATVPPTPGAHHGGAAGQAGVTVKVGQSSGQSGVTVQVGQSGQVGVAVQVGGDSSTGHPNPGENAQPPHGRGDQGAGKGHGKEHGNGLQAGVGVNVGAGVGVGVGLEAGNPPASSGHQPHHPHPHPHPHGRDQGAAGNGLGSTVTGLLGSVPVVGTPPSTSPPPAAGAPSTGAHPSPAGASQSASQKGEGHGGAAHHHPHAHSGAQAGGPSPASAGVPGRAGTAGPGGPSGSPGGPSGSSGSSGATSPAQPTGVQQPGNGSQSGGGQKASDSTPSHGQTAKHPGPSGHHGNSHQPDHPGQHKGNAHSGSSATDATGAGAQVNVQTGVGVTISVGGSSQSAPSNANNGHAGDGKQTKHKSHKPGGARHAKKKGSAHDSSGVTIGGITL